MPIKGNALVKGGEKKKETLRTPCQGVLNEIKSGRDMKWRKQKKKKKSDRDRVHAPRTHTREHIYASLSKHTPCVTYTYFAKTKPEEANMETNINAPGINE